MDWDKYWQSRFLVIPGLMLLPLVFFFLSWETESARIVEAVFSSIPTLMVSDYFEYRWNGWKDRHNKRLPYNFHAGLSAVGFGLVLLNHYVPMESNLTATFGGLCMTGGAWFATNKYLFG